MPNTGVDYKVEIHGLDKLLDNLKILPAMVKGIEAAALHVKGVIARYPPVSRRPQPFKTEKQRRYFFYALKNKLISVPYKRGISPQSETLGKKWTITTRNNGLEAIVGNNVSYGPLVQSREKQSAYHKETGWKTVEDVTETEVPKVVDYIDRAISQMIAGKS